MQKSLSSLFILGYGMEQNTVLRVLYKLQTGWFVHRIQHDTKLIAWVLKIEYLYYHDDSTATKPCFRHSGAVSCWHRCNRYNTSYSEISSVTNAWCRHTLLQLVLSYFPFFFMSLCYYLTVLVTLLMYTVAIKINKYVMTCKHCTNDSYSSNIVLVCDIRIAFHSVESWNQNSYLWFDWINQKWLG